MDDGRIPKDLLYGELSSGSRPRGRPRLRFKDTCKRDLKSAGISSQSWETTAESRSLWKAAVSVGTEEAEQSRTADLKDGAYQFKGIFVRFTECAGNADLNKSY